MNKTHKTLLVFSLFSIIGLVLLMPIINANVSDMYDAWGPGLSHKSVLVLAMTLLPVPTIIGMFGVAVFARNDNLPWILQWLAFSFWAQAAFCLAIPVLLATLEHELNFPTLAMPALGICASLAFVFFLRSIQENIASKNSDHTALSVETVKQPEIVSH
ncbi:MAG: hypothetical protein SPI12_00535 [Actinomycetaceae bacterium]|nr:hypothetical protein [Actinomycetaceae bacterium]MDY6082339.1 hypothetical protein [Actinomycetaceae bacterium]